MSPIPDSVHLPTLFFFAIALTIVIIQSLSHVWLFGPHGLQHARLPCSSPSPGACSDSCSLNQWCHPTILSSVIPFSSCLQSFLASGSFLMSWLFTSGGQSIGTSASVLLTNIQDWFPLGMNGLISLLSRGLSGVFSNTTVQKHYSSLFSLLYGPTLTSIHDYWKMIALTTWTFVGKVMSLLYNTLSRFAIPFLGYIWPFMFS